KDSHPSMQARYVRLTFHARAMGAIDVHQLEPWKHTLASSHELRSLTDDCSVPNSRDKVRCSCHDEPKSTKFRRATKAPVRGRRYRVVRRPCRGARRARVSRAACAYC